MDRGVFAARSDGERAALGELIIIHINDVTEKRPGRPSRAAEKSRLQRFMHGEPRLYAYVVGHLRPEHFGAYRDRRSTQFATRGKPGRRGRCRPEKPKRGRLSQ